MPAPTIVIVIVIVIKIHKTSEIMFQKQGRKLHTHRRFMSSGNLLVISIIQHNKMH